MKGKITVLIGLVLMLEGMLWYAVMLKEATVAANEVREVTLQLRQVIMKHLYSFLSAQSTITNTLDVSV